MKSNVLKYLIEAFNARPLGTFVPPNWVGLAIFGMLGFVNEGFWIVGLGLEMAYMGSLVFNERFQRYVDGLDASQSQIDALREVDAVLQRLPRNEADRYRALHGRCVQMLADNSASGPLLEDNLNRMLWVYVRLLQTFATLTTLIDSRGSDTVEELTRQLNELNKKIQQTPNEELRRSLSGQAEIVAARLKARTEAMAKRDVVQAELDRIEQQVQYLQEQTAMSRAPDVAGQVDSITDSLNSTNSWISEHQKIFGLTSDDDGLALKPIIQQNKE